MQLAIGGVNFRYTVDNKPGSTDRTQSDQVNFHLFLVILTGQYTGQHSGIRHDREIGYANQICAVNRVHPPRLQHMRVGVSDPQQYNIAALQFPLH